MISQKRTLDEVAQYSDTKRQKIEDYKGTATIEDVPVEVMWKILEYLDNESILSLRTVCNSISKTLTVIFYHVYNTITNKILKVRKDLQRKLVKDENEKRQQISQSLIHLAWIETELISLEAIVHRYKVNSENPLFIHLWPILKEFLNTVNSVTEDSAQLYYFNLQRCSRLPLWSYFIDRFDVEVEPYQQLIIPFETKVIDILTCCPSANLNIKVKWSLDGTVEIKAFFQIHDSLNERLITEFDSCPSDGENRKSLLALFRSIIRKRNSNFLSSLLEDINKSENNPDQLDCKSSKNNFSKGDLYLQMLSSVFRPLISIENTNNSTKTFIRRSTYNVSSNFMEWSIERNQLKIAETPLIVIYPSLFKIERTQKIDNLLTNSIVQETKFDSPLNLTWTIRSYEEN